MEYINFKKILQKKTRNTISYNIIAFHEGLSYISALAIKYFFKDYLKLEPAFLSTVYSIVHIPWAIKPLLGLITDLCPIFGYRRKIYILLCALINFICLLLMSFYVETVNSALICIFFMNLTLSFLSVLGEAIVVEISQMETTNKRSKAKDNISSYFIYRTLGQLISSYLKGKLIDIVSLRNVFFIACLVPSIVFLAGLIFDENKNEEEDEIENENDNNYNKLSIDENEKGSFYVSINEEEDKMLKKNPNLDNNSNKNSNNNDENNENKKQNTEKIIEKKNLIKQLIAFASQKHILIPLLFMLLFKSTPSYHDAFFYFLTNSLKFTATDLGEISFCSHLAMLIAIYIYRIFLKNFSFKKMIIIGTCISFMISSLCFIMVLRLNIKFGIPDFWLLLFTDSFLSLVGELVLMPILSLGCVLCPKDLEGTSYSLFMSALNVGNILSHLNGSFLTKLFNITSDKNENLKWFILFTKIYSLLPLPILYFIEINNLDPKENNNNIDISNFTNVDDIADSNFHINNNELMNDNFNSNNNNDNNDFLENISLKNKKNISNNNDYKTKINQL
jgi:folate/biopterin transporter